MKCVDCELLLANGESNLAVEEHLRGCAACRTLAGELRANSAVLEALRGEELPPMAVQVPRRRTLYPWLVGTAAAAAALCAFLLPRSPAPAPLPAPTPRAIVAIPEQPLPAPEPVTRPSAEPITGKVQPLKIKMLTQDPDVVIYWIVD